MASSLLPLLSSNPPDYYSFHQKARTTASRLCKPPAGNRKPDYQGAITVLFECAKEMLKKGQWGSGVDLGVYMLDVYDLGGVGCGDVERGRVTQLIALVTGEEGNWRKTMIDKSLSWSTKVSSYPSADPLLHAYIAEMFYKEGNFAQAEPHFLNSASRDSARLFGQMMAEWYRSASSSSSSVSAGVFAAHGVIPYLLLGSVLAASSFLSSFLSHYPLPTPTQEGGITLTPDPVLNFLQMAVITCQRGTPTKAGQEAWVRLCGTYQSKGGILSEPMFRRALQEIASLYFGFAPPRSGPANPMADMIAGLFGGGGDGGAPEVRKLAPPGMDGMLD